LEPGILQPSTNIIIVERELGLISIGECSKERGCGSLGAVKAKAKVYRSIEELPEVLEPGRYIVEDVEVIIHEPVEREEIAYQLRKNRELAEKYGSRGWV